MAVLTELLSLCKLNAVGDGGLIVLEITSVCIITHYYAQPIAAATRCPK